MLLKISTENLMVGPANAYASYPSENTPLELGRVALTREGKDDLERTC